MCQLSWNLRNSTSWNPEGLSRPVMGLLYVSHFKWPLLTFVSIQDTFYDPEDGDTRNLKLSLLTMDRTQVPLTNWLQFDVKNQEFFGTPMLGDKGREEYQLVRQLQILFSISLIELLVLHSCDSCIQKLCTYGEITRISTDFSISLSLSLLLLPPRSLLSFMLKTSKWKNWHIMVTGRHWVGDMMNWLYSVRWNWLRRLSH